MHKNKLDIFKNKKVLITGNTGFKGSWLTIWLLKIGAEVIGYSKDIPTSPSIFKSCKLNEKIEYHEGNLLNKDLFGKIIKDSQPDFIFHLAAQPLVKESYENPFETIQSNSIGTINLLEILKEYDQEIIVIFITSDKVYDNVEWLWGYKETDTLGGKDPYSASKAMAEIAIRSYYQSFLKEKESLRIGIGRAGNVIGGGDWSANRIVPDCIVKWINKEKVQIRNPKATRPWQHVLEPLSGYLTLAYELNNSIKVNGEAFNFGPSENSSYSVEDLIKEMIKYWPTNIKNLIEIKKDTFHEASLLKLNCDKSSALLDWKSSLNFKDCVKNTIQWYENYYFNNENILNFTEKQIDFYQINSDINY